MWEESPAESRQLRLSQFIHFNWPVNKTDFNNLSKIIQKLFTGSNFRRTAL